MKQESYNFKSHCRNNKGCEGCFFRKRVTSDQTFCDYLGETGHIRNCPSGVDCIHYITRAQMRKKRKLEGTQEKRIVDVLFV